MLQLAEVAEDLGFVQFSARFVSWTDVTDGRAKTMLLRGEEVFVNVSHFCINKPLNQCSCTALQHLQERWSSFERMPPEKKRIIEIFLPSFFPCSLIIQGVLLQILMLFCRLILAFFTVLIKHVLK